MSKEMIEALDALEVEKGVKKEVVVEALEAALESAYKRNYNQAPNVEVTFDQNRVISTFMRLRKSPKKFLIHGLKSA